METTGVKPIDPASLPTKATDTKDQFVTGAVRSSAEGRGRPQDISPFAVYRLSRLLERGAKLYGERNYQRGMSMDRTMGSLLRHAFQAMAKQTDEDHLAAVMFNAMVLLDTDERVRLNLAPESLRDL